MTLAISNTNPLDPVRTKLKNKRQRLNVRSRLLSLGKKIIERSSRRNPSFKNPALSPLLEWPIAKSKIFFMPQSCDMKKVYQEYKYGYKLWLGGKLFDRIFFYCGDHLFQGSPDSTIISLLNLNTFHTTGTIS